MPDWSRRQLLQAAALPTLGALAGCSESNDQTDERVDPSIRSKEPITNYEMTKVRNKSGAALAGSNSNSADAETYDHITKEETIPSFTSVSEARALERFVRDTDFATQSILLLVRTIPECYRLRLVSASKEDDGVDSRYCRDMRPADVSCDQDATDTVGIAIRLPLAGDSFNSLGMGFSSSCDDRPTVVNFDPVTPAANSTSSTGGVTE